MNILTLLLIVLCCLTPTDSQAQRPDYSKLSPMLRRMARQEAAAHPTPLTAHRSPLTAHHSPLPSSVCAFVKVADGGEDALREKGCRILTQMDDLCIADIPLDMLRDLSLDRRILRIEANQSKRPQTDSLAWYLNALPVYEGQQLPQAFTGRGVVVGVMDIGFDLTHPNFYSRDTTEYRIQRFWDMISADTVGSQLYVGRDYVGRDELLAVAHARDGVNQTHGTHTLGIAAGSGYNTDYRGLAPESDICIVANAVSDDIAFIDEDDFYKYTFATDALGFKYIFDYAESQHKPCVINFSEGSRQDFWGYDVLYYEMLGKLIGPGRIIVSAAGNYGHYYSWLRKPADELSAGAFMSAWGKSAMLTFKADADFALRLVSYGDASNDTLVVDTREVLACEDSTLNASLASLEVSIEAYPSCYDSLETCFDLTLKGQKNFRSSTPVSFEVIGHGTTVEAYVAEGYMELNTELNPLLNKAEKTHSILSPASSPDIICVGATNYRQGMFNYKGEWLEAGNGIYGSWCINSSVGPTFDGRIKPDVMAPGINIISSYSSYYLENHPNANDIGWDVAHFDFNGRTYAWNSNSGTSMSSPAVAGAIALWLQAKPDLTTEEILDVFRHTCRHYDPELTYPNNYYGYGEIDVYAGLLYLLGVDRIEGISTTQAKARVAYFEGRLTVDFDEPLTSSTHVSIYSLAGRKLFSATLTAGQHTFNMSVPDLPKAYYAVQFSTAGGRGSSTIIAVP